MSQQRTTDGAPAALRRPVLVIVLFSVAWLAIALSEAGRLGLALGGSVLVVTGVLALCWRREIWMMLDRTWPGFRLPPRLERFNTVAWGAFSMLCGFLALVGAAVR